MKFDVIVGNPPYQLETEGAGKQARPIYQLFVRQAKRMNPRFLIMITPSRWMSGGMGLDEYRDEMLNDRRISKIVDYSLASECFPGVDIAGGVSYFLWKRDQCGDCAYTYIDGDSQGTAVRKLNEYPVFVRSNNAIDIVRKATFGTFCSVGNIMSSLGVFGLGTAERGEITKTKDSYVLVSSAGRSYIRKGLITAGFEYVDKWKVIIGKATSAGAATAGKDGLRKVIATLDVLEPGAVCTFSYFIGGAFNARSEAENCKTYYATKFARFLLLQTLSSINITRDRFQFVPMQDFSKPWTDAELYAKYKLTKDEIAFIESMIKPME